MVHGPSGMMAPSRPFSTLRHARQHSEGETTAVIRRPRTLLDPAVRVLFVRQSDLLQDSPRFVLLHHRRRDYRTVRNPSTVASREYDHWSRGKTLTTKDAGDEDDEGPLLPEGKSITSFDARMGSTSGTVQAIQPRLVLLSPLPSSIISPAAQVMESAMPFNPVG